MHLTYFVMYNYTIIIPHKNIPDYLQRCLDSIPRRKDIQVIVVDDGSEAAIVDFNHFPGFDQPNVEIYREKGSKGPGFARNIGLKHAQGRWVVFADADDYFLDSFASLMDDCVDSKSDIVFFKSRRHSETEGEFDYPMVNNLVDEALSGNPDGILFGFPCPWGKFICRDFLEKNGIRYEEVTGGDDILFSVRMATVSPICEFSEQYLYCVEDRPGSLTRRHDSRIFVSYVKSCCKAFLSMKPMGKEAIAKNWLISWWGFLWAENKTKALYLVLYMIKDIGFRTTLYCVKKGIKRGIWDWKTGH